MSRIILIFATYLSMWNNTFNIKKPCLMREYLWAIVVHASICVLLALFAVFNLRRSQYMFLYNAILIFNYISFIPIISLTVRCVVTAKAAKWCPVLCTVLCYCLIIALILFVAYRYIDSSIIRCFPLADPVEEDILDSIVSDYFSD